MFSSPIYWSYNMTVIALMRNVTISDFDESFMRSLITFCYLIIVDLVTDLLMTLAVEAEKHSKEKRSKKDHKKHNSKRGKRPYKGRSDSDSEVDAKEDESYKNSKHGRHQSETNKTISDAIIQEEEGRKRIRHDSSTLAQFTASRPKKQPKLSKEKTVEMQLDAELHEENRWKQLNKASENDVREVAVNFKSDDRGHFLDAAKKSVYGA
ncbi:hypothetical protein GIB67_033350 [Kingdonia uniflora]|uniref:Uncharacterized protein n=1 Tax=Kingdonia uniflora TaxID=39325 RepID=A0A7J7LTJ1_9MAGN|nr:hypothetical protein GIB67_033350 [Kingdonia uniflora]